ncbi:TetR/AcrR family transcriptional repressor of multidrug resistance operon [Oxalobacteraceae bacterium GrIS 1.11]
MKLKDDKKLDAIALATYRLVAERGLSALTLAAIAREAGIATSTLYVYYASKEALLNALYARAKSATFERFVENDQPNTALKPRIRQIWSNMLDNRGQHHAQVLFLEQCHGSQYMSEGNRELGAGFAAFFHAILEQGQLAEILKQVPLPFLVASITGSVKETARLIGSHVVPDDAASRATSFLLCWDAIKA